MSMQISFCLLEAGLVRSKDSVNVALKNLIGFCVATLLFWPLDPRSCSGPRRPAGSARRNSSPGPPWSTAGAENSPGAIAIEPFSEVGPIGAEYTRDLVSGVFYWCKRASGFRCCAVVDGTGHGVPGAHRPLWWVRPDDGGEELLGGTPRPHPISPVNSI